MAGVWKVRAAFLAGVACLAGCDRASKVAAEAALSGHEPLSLVRGVLDLRYAENRDVAFNALSRVSVQVPAWGLTAFAALATMALLVAWAARRRRPLAQHAGFALVAAGALGNALDRVLRGSVVDFMHVHHWPVFNVADVLIVAGVALLALARQRKPGTSIAA
ncbi:MAG TPA: signal peptidase II [Polyangiaceae bacterium]|nr:signal peptidase II [Polyangiaceae bacterium]